MIEANSQIEYAREFLNAVKTRSLRLIQSFFIAPPYELDQETISTTLKTAGRWDVVEWLIRIKNPDHESVSHCLMMAAEQNQNDLVTLILNLKAENKPNYNAIKRALDAAASAGNRVAVERLVKDITTFDQLSEEDSSSALNSTFNLEVAEYLIKTLNPDRASVEKKLLAAARSNQQFSLIKLILSLSGENKPSDNSVKQAFFLMAASSHLGKVQYFFQLTSYPVNQETVSTALTHVQSSDVARWIISTQSPTQESIDILFTKATKRGSRSLINTILSLCDIKIPLIMESITFSKNYSPDLRAEVILSLETKLKEKHFSNFVKLLYLGFFDKNSTLSALPFELIVSLMKWVTAGMYSDNERRISTGIKQLNNLWAKRGASPLFAYDISNKPNASDYSIGPLESPFNPKS